MHGGERGVLDVDQGKPQPKRPAHGPKLRHWVILALDKDEGVGATLPLARAVGDQLLDGKFLHFVVILWANVGRNFKFKKFNLPWLELFSSEVGRSSRTFRPARRRAAGGQHRSAGRHFARSNYVA